MKIKDVMRRHPLTARPADTLGLAGEIMAWAGLRYLPVVDDGRLVGLLGERDLAVFLARAGAPGRAEPVRLLMDPHPQTAGPDDALTEAAARMEADRLDCFPIVERGQLVGLLGAGDLLAEQVREAFEPGPAPGPRVGEIMTREVASVHPDDDLLDAAARMQQLRVRHLPVVDGVARVVGMLSDRDVRTAIGDPGRAFSGRSSTHWRLRVKDAMTRAVITTTPDRPCTEVTHRFIDGGIGAVPVVDIDERLVGIVSYVDVLRALAPRAA